VFGVLGTVAQRRVVLIDLQQDPAVVCAEPSPDAADSIASAFAAALQGETNKLLRCKLPNHLLA
jgi:hypothetical protein